jgi:hypothetical protein
MNSFPELKSLWSATSTALGSVSSELSALLRTTAAVVTRSGQPPPATVTTEKGLPIIGGPVVKDSGKAWPGHAHLRHGPASLERRCHSLVLAHKKRVAVAPQQFRLATPRHQPDVARVQCLKNRMLCYASPRNSRQPPSPAHSMTNSGGIASARCGQVIFGSFILRLCMV